MEPMRLFFIVAVKEPQDETFRRILEPSLKPEWLENTILVYEGSSIFEKYNKGIDVLVSKFSLKDDDVVVYIHNDVQIKDLNFEEKIQMVFKHRPDVGLIGVYGSTCLGDNGTWWKEDRPSNGRGNVLQRYLNGNIYTMTDKKGFFDDIVSLDGLIMIERGSVAKMKLFDSDTYNFYHHYDSDHCCEVLEKTSYKIAIADILVFHDSPGATTNVDKFYDSMDRFTKKWSSKGYTFPLTVESFKK
jgi:hypothetical protein